MESDSGRIVRRGEMGAYFHFRGGPLAVARRVDGKSRPGSRETCEEVEEEEPERR